ncbi:hypothetical protein HHK36_015100 [Tetracentron sinense]|uniref:FHA domain-containing protein n=1 Tax=Tetracentron sinense TaxID=13715 RepID=A0A834Z442_TETSI|nr:hypothetical protein HHK36_015100 [Tetracentron sinense]
MKAAMGPPPPRNPSLTSSNTNPSVDTQMDAQNEPSNSATMKAAMGPPPPKNPNLSSSSTNSSSVDTQMNDQNEPSNSAPMEVPMGSPPPRNPNPHESDTIPSVETHINDQQEPQANQSNTHVAEPEEMASENPNPKPTSNSTSEQSQCVAVPYKIPPWSEPPCHPFALEVLKDGSIVDQFNVSEKGAYMFGRVDLCDFVLEHPTISRFHAVLQFKENGDAYLYDLGSTHGTFVNKIQEKDLKIIRKAKIREEMQDCEASLSRARLEASLADGISWGMAEDAIEEAEDEPDEITWQTYKGQLTEKQEKTREKVIKRTEKACWHSFLELFLSSELSSLIKI